MTPMFASIWHTLWINVFWDHGDSSQLPRAIAFDLFLVVTLGVLVVKATQWLKRRN